MKNRLTKNLLIAALASAALITTVDAQNRDKPGGGQGNQGNFGAPNSLRDGNGDRDGNANRQTVRKPSGSRERDGDNAHKPGQGRKPGTGMGRSDQPGQTNQKPKPKPNLREVLDLTDEQAKALHAARKKWRELAKSINENKELSKEEKQAKVMEGHKKLDAKVREILTEEQYAQLRDLRRRNARPGNQNEQRRPQGGGQDQGRPQRRPQGGGQGQGRPQQGGGQQQGRPQGRPQQGGGQQQQGRPQRRPQGGEQGQGRPQRRPQPKNR